MLNPFLTTTITCCDCVYIFKMQLIQIKLTLLLKDIGDNVHQQLLSGRLTLQQSVQRLHFKMGTTHLVIKL